MTQGCRKEQNQFMVQFLMEVSKLWILYVEL